MSIVAVHQLFYYQFCSSCRSFASVFYTIFLPLVIFAIFGTFFGVDENYAVFFLPGMLGVMSSSDALFAVGPVIKEYFRQGIVREFRSYPINMVWLFTTFIFTRILFVMTSALLLCVASVILFGYFPNLEVGFRIVLGLILNFFTYGFIALTISFWGIADNRDQGILSIYYFLGMFLSDAFFNLSQTNDFFYVVGYFFPLRVTLEFIRGDYLALIWCLIWLLSAITSFILQMRMMSTHRK